MRKIVIFAILFTFVFITANAQVVQTVKATNGSWQLLVDGRPFFVKGVTWSLQPPGTNFTYELWRESDATIRRVIDYDATMMKEIGVNTVRLFSTIPPKWVEYLYNRHGIYTIINDTFGRWGVTVDGRWIFPTDYHNPKVREAVFNAHAATIEKYKDVQGVLMYMYGNENNYGFYWNTAAIEDLPPGTNLQESRARAFYSLMNDVMVKTKEIDPSKPVGFINGDLGYINIIAEECPSLDILGVNLYRGLRPGAGFWREVQEKLDVPVMFGEIGADAWNSRLEREDQYNQALYTSTQWQDIYENAYGKGRGNAIGGCVFEWVDEWWKAFAGTNDWDRLDEHKTHAGWRNEGFSYDIAPPPARNMNEEWWGIVSQGERTYHGWYTQKNPRAAYYVLQHIWSVDPWNLNAQQVTDHFAKVDLGAATARGLQDSQARYFFMDWNVKNQFTFTTMQSGDEIFFRPEERKDDNIFQLFNNQQWGAVLRTTFSGSSYITTVPNGKVAGEITVQMRHDAGENLSGEIAPVWSKIFRTQEMGNEDKPIDIYQGFFTWEGAGFEVAGNYHRGKPGWHLEGDFFNIHSENWDLYTNDQWGLKGPLAMEVKYDFGLGKRQGLSVVGGPNIFAGAHPQIAAKWYQVINTENHDFGFAIVASQEFSHFDTFTQRYHDPATKASLNFEWSPKMKDHQNLSLRLGALTSNFHKIDQEYVTDFTETNERVGGVIDIFDTLAFKGHVTFQPIQYASFDLGFVYAGLVADTNSIPHPGFFTSMILTDIGIGNRMEYKGGVRLGYGNFTLHLHGLYRKPLIPALEDASRLSSALETINGGLGNPFRVYNNREALIFETFFVFDLEPASWTWEWNTLDREGAKFASALSARYVVFEKESDPGFYKSVEGHRRPYGSGFPENEGNFDVNWRVHWNPTFDLRIVNVLGAHRGFPNDGLLDASRPVITGFSESLTVRYKRWISSGTVAYNLWGPVSMNKDFNQTYPLLWSLETGLSFGPKPSLMDSRDRIGIRWNGVIRDQYSPHHSDGRDSQEFVLFFDFSF